MVKRYPVDGIEETLEYWGELHVELEDGIEYHLHKHDVEVVETDPGGTAIIVDSKLGDWDFYEVEICNVEYPHSHKE